MIEGRYIYFGNYSGLDTTMAKELKHVREYDAKELTSPLCPDALKMDFFKKPNYGGYVYALGDANAMTIGEEEEVKLTEEMANVANNDDEDSPINKQATP
ncbi:hypothetical protein FB567DRAFT_598345 [Paraphoma chrysanthemicola]|uniref:Uncharacterized protein n=1 Tax=Paraphoma chrysanthemicola TaxID=798071 RepID=A0A8K0QU65_9PLEO|nr:hypothetical protein FB567DRAFT_598345 [Paraphoma chrysanthemicola]